jgi:AraC-like DNA-binding protein
MDRAHAEPLDVRAVAAVAHLSETHFIRSFRAVFGETPSGYRVAHGPMVAPTCFQLATTRPRVAAGVAMRSSSFGEAAAAAAP